MPEDQGKSPDRVQLTMSDGATIAVRRWGQSKRRRMVVSHGNGLAIDGFRAFGAGLEDEFEVIAFDMRSHGESGPGEALDDPWPRFLRDMPEIYDGIQDAFGDKPTHGAFHSLSSASALMAQGQDPRPWRSLSLYEPPVPPAIEEELCDAFNAMHLGLAKRTLARRRFFDAPDRLTASFRRSPTFGGIAEPALRQLAEAMLHRTDTAPETPWELICDPQMEANTYDTRDLGKFWEAIGAIDRPVQIVRGSVMGHDMPILIQSTTVLARRFGFAAATVEGGGHMMQLQRPRRSAELALAFADNVPG